MDGKGVTTVLVVDDEPSIRVILSATLRSAGYRVLVAESGVEALGLARRERPDLVLSDVMMDGGDGQALLAALRADPVFADLPFVFLTGLDERDAVRAGMNLGADDYLTKPFRPTELLSLVQAQLRRHARRSEVRRQLEDEARKLRQFDGVTGLPNRAHFVEQLTRTAQPAPWLVASLALGQWPLLRQSMGQGFADEVMREAANRLLDSVRARLGPEAALARSGEHRFALALPVPDDEIGVEPLLREVLSPLGLPMDIAGRRMFFDPSVGIATQPRDGASPAQLLDHAETAEPATAPGGTLAFFSAENSAAKARRVRLLQDLRLAIERRELSLAYQPQLSPAGERLVGFEALLRWHHGELGQVAPSEFIPLAEESGLIVPIGAWVLAEALRQLGQWRDDGLDVPRVAVNLSPRQFEAPELLGQVRSALLEAGLADGSLELEVTESAALQDPERAPELMAALRSLGVALALDDFGTGYSNLSQLKHLPIAALKIDQIFVRNIVHDTGDAAIVRAVVALAHGFSMKVVAEGVETQAQVVKLAQLGCDACQGYHYGAPMAANALWGWMQERGFAPD